MGHSKQLKNTKTASIRRTLGSLYEEPDFSRTCGFRREFREGPSFQKIDLSNPLSCLVFRQNSIMCQNEHVFVIIEWSRFFTENPAVLRTPVYQGLTLCQKFWKSLRGKYPVCTSGNFDSPQGEKSKLPTVTSSTCSTSVLIKTTFQSRKQHQNIPISCYSLKASCLFKVAFFAT